MKKIIAFAGSNSKTSINKQLVTFAGSLLENVTTEVLDLNDFELPTYSVNIEQESGIEKNAQRFFDKITEADGIILSLAEHNGNYAAVFKSLFDWLSRIDGKLFQGKPMLLMSTSPGGRGGQTVFEIAEKSFPRFNTEIVGKFMLPSFDENFKDGALVKSELLEKLKIEVKALETVILN